MKASYDPDTDALYLRLADAPVTDSEEVRPGIVLDYDAAGRLVAIEVLDAKEHLASGSDLANLVAAKVVHRYRHTTRLAAPSPHNGRGSPP